MVKTHVRILITGLLIGLITLLTSCADNLPTLPTINPDATSGMYVIEMAGTQTASAASAMETQVVELQKTPILEKVVDLLVIFPDNSWIILSKDDLARLPMTSVEKNDQELTRVSLTAIVEWTKVSDFTRISLFGSGGTLTLPSGKIQPLGLILFADSETEYYGKYLLDDGEWLGAISIIKIEK